MVKNFEYSRSLSGPWEWILLSLLGVLSVLLLGAQFIDIFNHGQTLVELGDSLGGTRWLTALRLDNNAYHLWSVDALTSLFSSSFSKILGKYGDSTNLSSVWLTQLIILTLGNFNFVRVSSPYSRSDNKQSRVRYLGRIPCFTSAILISLIVGLVAPRDIVSLGSICWLPLLFSVLKWLSLRSEGIKRLKTVADSGPWIAICVVCIVSAMHLSSASFLAPLTFILFWGVFGSDLFSNNCVEGKSYKAQSTITFKRVLALGCSIWLALWIALIWNGAAAPIPDYPADATVVPDDGVPGITRALGSSDYPLVVSHPFSLRFFWGIPSITLSVLLLLIVMGKSIARRGTRKLNQNISLVEPVHIKAKEPRWNSICFLSICCLLDLYLPAQFKEIAPLASLSRIFPGAFLIPLVPIFLSLSVLNTLLTSLTEQVKYGALRFLGSVALLGALPLFFDRNLRDCRFPLNWGSEIHIDSEVDAGQARASDICKSPSRWLVTNYSEEVIVGYKKSSGTHSVPLPLSRAIAFNTPLTEGSPLTPDSLHTQSLTNTLVDHHKNTRWASANKGQQGNEWLRLDFSQATSLDGILLSTGDFKSDFPAGLRIECVRADVTISEAFNVEEWLGPVLFTNRGYPYLGPASDVRAIFPKTQECISLVIHQTGQRPILDWSIAEVRGLTTNP